MHDACTLGFLVLFRLELRRIVELAVTEVLKIGSYIVLSLLANPRLCGLNFTSNFRSRQELISNSKRM